MVKLIVFPKVLYTGYTLKVTESVKKEKIIEIEAHAFLRMLERGLQFGLDYCECRERAFCAVKLGNFPKRKHLSKDNITSYQYFKDNLSFYVICQEKDCSTYIQVLIKTVIIEEGRE